MDFDRLVYHFNRVGNKPRMIIDVGANKGQWFSECRKRFKCMMYLFEADEDNKVCLQNEIEKSYKLYGQIPTITYFTLLGNEIKEDVIFYKAKIENNTGNSMYLENSCYFRDHEVVKLNMETLDHIIGNSYLKIDLIKLDVQGAELDILKGAKDKVLPKCDLILMEVALLQYNKGSPLICEVFVAMDNYGFQAIDILEKHYFGNDMIQADFLFARKGSEYIKDKFGY